jgi:hypothetical protein
MSKITPLAERHAVFISHANPEDNAFSTWLTLRLTREGYRVWCDVVKLRGGDDFWRDIETAIREDTRKFIFVTSRASNQKNGTLKELAVAEGVARQLNDTGFIVPVKIDDLPYADHNIQINRLNALNFTHGWAEGLCSLLETLKDDGVPKAEPTGPGQVASWWNASKLNYGILTKRPETLWTNWFKLQQMPPKLYGWEVPPDYGVAKDYPYPVHRIGDLLFSFADAEGLTGKNRSLTGGKPFSVSSYLDSEPPSWIGLNRGQLGTVVKQLLRQAWEKYIDSRGLAWFQLSNRRRTFWFQANKVPGDTIT